MTATRPSRTWQRTFEIAAPVERVWRSFTDPEERQKLYGDAESEGERGDDAHPSRPDPTEVLEVEPMKKLRFARTDGPESPEGSGLRSEFEIQFEATATGSKIHVTRYGFGEGSIADIFSEANALGWEHGFMDAVFYLETGLLVRRHYLGAGPSRMGMAYAETDFGLIVEQTLPGGFASEAGLLPGDRLLRFGGCAVYKRSDVWMVNGLFAPGAELEVEFVRAGELRRARGTLSGHDVWGVGE